MINERPLLVEETVSLVARWLERSRSVETADERAVAEQLEGVIAEPTGLSFAMRFVDRVIRPDDVRVAAHQLATLVRDEPLPAFLSRTDKVLLAAGARLAPVLPSVVMPLAIRRMRGLVGHLVADAEPAAMRAHLGALRADRFRVNVNLLGEAVLGHAEAERRLARATELLDDPDIDYVSVKISAVVAQLDRWGFDASVERVVDVLRPMFVRAAQTTPATFVNLDMEEYHDLELTMAAFMHLLDEDELHASDAGIVLQAYLPDSFAALEQLVNWAGERRRHLVDGRRGGVIKIRLVKGANLAMEHVEAAMHGWELAPYHSKAETDANYKRCLDWVLTPERTDAVRIGLASHNLFDVAWGHLLARERGIGDRLEIEMLQGMAPSAARVVRDDSNGLLLYTPVVRRVDFDVAISYLFRRLEENASKENFIQHLFELEPGSAAFVAEAAKFRASVAARHSVGNQAQRAQDRRRAPTPFDTSASFANEPDTDPALEANREWTVQILAAAPVGPTASIVEDTGAIDRIVAASATAQPGWASRSTSERRMILHRVGDELARRRGDLIAAMVHEGSKTVAQADPEVSEAIDFARWYADRALDLGASDSARFEPLGVVAVVPPWNFPVAIPAGGVLAALAAGNGVVFKPAPETPRCAEIVAECCWAGGVPPTVLQFVRTRDDEIGRHLITHPSVSAVILTGAYDTAALFRSWKPDLRVFAETSGKNALVITPNADLDLAVADLVAGAFGHAGQKCSAASLAICIGGVADSPRFLRQLVDAVSSLEVGPADRLSTTMGPLIHEPEGKLLRGLTELDAGEEWLVEPRRLARATWTPGVRVGVRPGSWFHQTECFGPVLGIMRAVDLDEAIALQNATDYGLTGGIHTLDPSEVDQWLAHVDVGNAYVNRAITGAIVRRQPFGGWKRSSIGPGAKAGGPNYVAQLGTWQPTDLDLDDDAWSASAVASDERAWRTEFSVSHDPSGLFCEANEFRYRPLPRIAVRFEGSRPARELERIRAAARHAGVPLVESHHRHETSAAFSKRLTRIGVTRVRVLGEIGDELRVAAAEAGVHLADDPVTTDGRIELLHYLREQSVSRTLHRYGNIV